MSGSVSSAHLAACSILLGNPALDLPRDAPMKTRYKMWQRLVGSAVLRRSLHGRKLPHTAKFRLNIVFSGLCDDCAEAETDATSNPAAQEKMCAIEPSCAYPPRMLGPKPAMSATIAAAIPSATIAKPTRKRRIARVYFAAMSEETNSIEASAHICKPIPMTISVTAIKSATCHLPGVPAQ